MFWKNTYLYPTANLIRFVEHNMSLPVTESSDKLCYFEKKMMKSS